MAEPPNVEALTTYLELVQALKEKRLRSGFDTIDQMLARGSGHGTLRRATAYDIEGGKKRSTWTSVKAYLELLGAEQDEVSQWRTAYDRATRKSGLPRADRPDTPTAKQLAELGSEEAARILSRIDVAEATDLLRRITVKQAAEVLPEISPSATPAIIAGLPEARLVLILESIDKDKGAEVLAGMPLDRAHELAEELDLVRSAELISAMPRGRAARLLDALPEKRSVRILTTMPSFKAARLLQEFDMAFATTLAATVSPSQAAPVFRNMDASAAADILTNAVDGQRAREILEQMSAANAAQILNMMDMTVIDTFVAHFSISTIAAIIVGLDTDKQMEIITRKLAPERAAAVLAETIVDEDLRYALSEIEPQQLARVLDHLPVPERALLLSALGGSGRVVLAALRDPAETAGQMDIDAIARHLSGISAAQGDALVTHLEFPLAELITRMEPGPAAKLARHTGFFEETARRLAGVAPARIGWILTTMDSWEAAATMVYLDFTEAAAALGAMTAGAADKILASMARRATDRTMSTATTDADFAVQRDRDLRAVAELRAAADRLRRPPRDGA